ncbi:sigma-54 interaction domain-containing protein, partial [Ralstonia pseudosolanacearum]|uniref:sigma-54 interaction domain-containing protein n=1 Tax=Ralstonia pseudosolanacearum TaxID=1310165 RepID=UPI003CF37E5C
PHDAQDSAAPALVGASSAFNAACHLLRRVAPTDATVLFTGESGVGKERFARMLHQISRRHDKPFIAINCAAIPETLVEAELFGVERGAYTGATHSRAGRFELAHEGTLFLDEIGTLSLVAQGKLLRALQEGEFERVGSSRSLKVDTRVVAATNEDLPQAVRAGRFRQDLFFRLNVFPIHLPPLRERRDDIPLLMSHFLKSYAHKHGLAVRGFSPRAIKALLNYSFPGNIRELQNLVERGVILAQAELVDLPHMFISGETLDQEVLSLAMAGEVGTLTHGREASAASATSVSVPRSATRRRRRPHPPDTLCRRTRRSSSATQAGATDDGASASRRQNGLLRRSSSAAVSPSPCTTSIQRISAAAARVVDSFQPVSSRTGTFTRASSARTRRATMRSCATSASDRRPALSQSTSVWAAKAASSSKRAALAMRSPGGGRSASADASTACGATVPHSGQACSSRVRNAPCVAGAAASGTGSRACQS